jgi:hypothetical protein
MDFLMLLPGRRRAVLELDGMHHYAREDGSADPSQYARAVRTVQRLEGAGPYPGQGRRARGAAPAADPQDR